MSSPTDVHTQLDPTPGERAAGIGLVIEGHADRQILQSRGVTRFELVLVAFLGLALLLPGIWSYTLIDPWETHYAEVSRRMLQDDDLVRTQWQNEGFRSKPALTFWMIAASLRATGHAKDGGFSGEMVTSDSIMLAVRLPFVLFGVLGLVLLFWMLARLVSRRVAWLAFFILGTTPFYFMVARQAITDMPMVACLMGALACFAMATQAEEAPLRPVLGRLDAMHLFAIFLALIVGWQIVYYSYHFAVYRHVVVRGFNPMLLPVSMLVLLSYFAVTSLFREPLYLTRDLLKWLVIAFPIGVPLLAIGWVRTLITQPSFHWRDWRNIELVRPIQHMRQVYMMWFYTLVFVSVLAKGVPGVGIAGAVCFCYLLLTNNWRFLWRIELGAAIVLALLVAVPWHIGMWLEEGPQFIREYVIGHNFKRAGDGMHGDRGTFNYFMTQIGIGMWPWVALLPAALASCLTRVTGATRVGQVRLLFGVWAVFTVAFFSAITTKFHHYIFPAIPALAVLIAFWVDDLLSGRVHRMGAAVVAALAIALLITRDLMHEQKQLVELFIYRYDRPWPGNPPWNIDLSDGFLAFGLIFASAIGLLAVHKLRRLALVGLFTAAIAFAYWAMNTYMSYAGMHWGMRTAAQTYYAERQIYGMDIWYYGARQVADEWDGFKGPYVIDTVVPEHIAEGQPMTIAISVMNRGNQPEREVTMVGRVSGVGKYKILVDIPPSELARIEPLVKLGRKRPAPLTKPWRMVNADRLIAWQLYWRGENFWSGDEIWARAPETKTAFKNTDNKAFLEYLDQQGIPGRRYFVITEASRARGLKNILSTERAKETFEIIDRSSNKFTMVSFTL